MFIRRTTIVAVPHKNGPDTFYSIAKVHTCIVEEPLTDFRDDIYILEDVSVNKFLKKITKQEFNELKTNPL